MTYSLEFRKKVLKVKEREVLSFSAVAKRFDVSRAAVFRWSKGAEIAKTRNKPWIKLDKEALKQDIEKYPDSYSYERAQRLGVSPSGIRYAKKRLGITYKKNSQSSQSKSRKTIYLLPKDSKIKR
jgi:transposase